MTDFTVGSLCFTELYLGPTFRQTRRPGAVDHVVLCVHVHCVLSES